MLHDEALEDRLLDRATWARSNGRQRLRCGSAEGNWRSPQRCDAPPLQVAVRVVAQRAYEVELVVVTLADLYRTVIVLHYIRQSPVPMIARKLRRRNCILEPEQVLANAREVVAQRLGQRVPLRYETPSYPDLSARI